MQNRLGKPSDSFGTSGRSAELFAKLALTFISLCLSLIVLEFGLRLFIPLDARNPPEYRFPDPVFGWALEPGAKYQYHMPEDTVTVSYNSQGWHDVEHEINKPEGVFRILILGDSFMEAYSVEMEEGFHRQLERLARATGENVEVINLAVGGYGTLQEYLVYHHIGRLYDPDLVLLGFFDRNDMNDNSQELSLMLKPEGITTIARPFLDANDPVGWTVIPGDFEAAQRLYTENRALLESQRNRTSQRLVTLRTILEEIRTLQRARSEQSEDSTTPSIAKERNELALVGVNYCVETPEYTKTWNVTERIFAKLKEEVNADGGQLIVVQVPAREEVSIDYQTEVSNQLAFPEKLCIEDAPGHKRLEGILKKLEIDYISLLPDFRRVARQDGLELYRDSDLHWNPAGHALSAELVATELIERGFLPVQGDTQSSTP